MKPHFVARRRQLHTLGATGVLLAVVMAGCEETAPGDGIPFVRASAGNAGNAGSSGSASLGGDAGLGGEGGAGGEIGNTGGSSHQAGSSGRGGNGGRGGSGALGGSSSTGGDAGAPSDSHCGNHVIEEGEECDDGNQLSGDGCSSKCLSSCETCEQTYCQEFDSDFRVFYDICYSMDGVAEGGPAAGVPRAELCRELVDCVRESGCGKREGFNIDFTQCYCVYATNNLECQSPTFERGKCAKEFQEASEQDAIGNGVLGNLQAEHKPLGAGYSLLNGCDKYACRDECLPSYVDESEITTISADILPVRNDAGESPLGDLFADAERFAGGTDFAFVFTGAVVPYGLPFSASPARKADADGRVLWSELYTVTLGYYDGDSSTRGGSLLVTMKLTGQQVYDLLSSQSLPSLYVSGLTYTWDAALPAASRVTEVRKGGVVIDKAASYTVTVDNLTQSNGFGVLANGLDKQTSSISPAQALIDYLKTLTKPVDPPALNRVTRLH